MDYRDFKNYLIDELRLSPSTVNDTLRRMPYIENKSKSMDREDLQELVRNIWNTRSNKTANEYIKIINRWLLYKNEKPLKYFKEYETYTVKTCTEEEKNKLLMEASREGSRERAIFYLLFGTGIRLGEAVNLKLKDVKNDRIFVTGKGQKEREIYLPSEVKNAIDDYLIERVPGKTSSDKDYLFTTKIGKKMSYNYFRKICKRVSMNSGVKFHPHMARHTYATELLKKGLSVFYVARLLGHEDLSSTQIYLHASQEDAIYEVSKIKLFENGQKQNDLDGKDRLGFEPK
ncbi:MULTISPECIES: tyrosine-type recombinase/integrase [Acidiplasma]|uniref:tyrosine-type recombinase/integrase n=2 Tax=Ferroplasmaceae TaxID=90142 RepID=UPI0009E4901C|nr:MULTISPECIES: tyrosine-type recombinase/integrase [Acidiplasma]WMT54623.1 MAG: tyrosine-type recombinase/integrase [Acidiplasma sp.]